MKEVNVTVSIQVPGEKVWALLADFGGFLKWAGGGTGEITLEGEGLGMVRHLKMAADVIAERLTLLDPAQRKLGYELVYGEPLGMKQYKALVQVVDADSGCEIIWKGEFDTDDPDSEGEVRDNLSAAYEGMTAALVAYLDQ
ncbi:MAG: SRPBCC family protein [Candidatus Azotimanducaceae bacterium WSBS_2022_MAG_OTU7]